MDQCAGAFPEWLERRQDMKYYHQYDEAGRHRLGTMRYKGKKVIWGAWAAHDRPANLGKYFVVTKYFASSPLFTPHVLCRVSTDVWPLTLDILRVTDK